MFECRRDGDVKRMRVFNFKSLRVAFFCAAVVTQTAYTIDFDRSDAWYRGEEGKRIAANILSYQDAHGGWPKNIDTEAKPYEGDRAKLRGTFDNGATVGEMRFLAKAYHATEELAYKNAFLKGLDLILKAQYPTGGWPQFYPPSKKYHRYITFNDGAMVRLMELLKEITASDDYGFVDAPRRAAAQQAFDCGIDCILKCQIRVNGKLTVWCAQHDEIDYSPRPARSFEPASLSGGESCGILRLLMSIDDPSGDMIQSIKAGVQWYEASKVEGVRLEQIDGVRTVVEDPDAPPLWARFYEIETNQLLFCDRDGVVKYDYNAVSAERRNGYTWYDDWGKDVFREYPKWIERFPYAMAPADAKILAIIGDSTVCNYPLEGVRRGWGQFIQDYFDDASIFVINTARSGRSTKTFREDGYWKETLNAKPAYVLIQFGHNDSHAPGKREATDAATTYRDYLRQYIEESRAIGAKVLFVTPMYRRKFDAEGKINDNLLPYAIAMKAVAAEKNVPVVDLNAASEELYLKLGPEATGAFANAPDDQTHFNEKGAKAMAELVMEQLPVVEPSLKECLK